MPTISQKGQTTIPVEVREALGIHPGDEIQFEETETGYVLRKQSDDDQFGKWHGAISSDQSMRERMEELRDRPLSNQSENTADEDSTDNERDTDPADVVSSTDGSD